MFDRNMYRVFYEADEGGGGSAVPTEALDDEVEVVPKTRFERFLAKIAGSDDDIEPRTRIEYFLNMIAEHVNGSEDSDQTEVPPEQAQDL